MSSESRRVGAPLILTGEVGFCLPSPLSTRQQSLGWPHHAEQAARCQQCGQLRPTLVAAVPGRTPWNSAAPVSAGAEGRGGDGVRSREGRFVPWHSSVALPLSGSAPSSCPWTCLTPWLAALTLSRATSFLWACKPQSLTPPFYCHLLLAPWHHAGLPGA